MALENKSGITDSAELAREEEKISKKKAVWLFESGTLDLILGVELKGKYIHVVVSCNEDYIYLITAYYPDEQHWQDNFKTRRN